MSSAESSADVLASKRQPRTPKRGLARWARLSVSALYLAVVPALIVRPGHNNPTVVPVPTFPATATSEPWYEPHPPCWITNTCPRS